MTVGELRALIKDLPDDTQVVRDSGNEGYINIECRSMKAYWCPAEEQWIEDSGNTPHLKTAIEVS